MVKPDAVSNYSLNYREDRPAYDKCLCIVPCLYRNFTRVKASLSLLLRHSAWGHGSNPYEIVLRYQREFRHGSRNHDRSAGLKFNSRGPVCLQSRSSLEPDHQVHRARFVLKSACFTLREVVPLYDEIWLADQLVVALMMDRGNFAGIRSQLQSPQRGVDV